MLEISCGLAPALTVQMRKRKLEEGARFPQASGIFKGIQRKIQIFFFFFFLASSNLQVCLVMKVRLTLSEVAQKREEE